MILFYFSDKSIHQTIPGFGVVTESGGNYWIDGWDTTTKISDVSWKYIAEQTLERDVDGAYLYDADHYAASQELTISDRMDALEEAFIEDLLSRL